MIKHAFMAAVLAVASIQIADAARSAVPLIEPERSVVINANGKAPGAEALRVAILRGGARHQWTKTDEQPGKLRLSFNKQNKHEVVVDVLYDGEGFQVRYVSSTGMQYASRGDGSGEIHPFYNRWVDNLGKAIKSEALLASP